jgi:hypothetical protein
MSPFNRVIQSIKEHRLLQRYTPFQIAITGLVLLCLVLQIIIVTLLLRTRSASQPILDRSDELIELADQGPYINQATAQLLLSLAAAELAELAESHIQYTVHISQSLLLATDILVDEQIPVPISLVVEHTLPVNTSIPFKKEILVPVNLDIDQVFSIDTTVPFQDEIVVPVDDVIHIDERFQTRLLGQTISIPIRGDIPVRLDVRVPIDKEFPIRADIPVVFNISESLPVVLDWNIPFELEIPITLPVETEVVVPFQRSIPISVSVPIVLDVPIDIALGDTPLGEYLRNLGQQLR